MSTSHPYIAERLVVGEEEQLMSLLLSFQCPFRFPSFPPPFPLSLPPSPFPPSVFGWKCLQRGWGEEEEEEEEEERRT